jgi:predicted patatin/cPLA2 family phospholipase
MPIIRAMELSCNIPFIFSRQIFEQCEYIDGSIGDHIPVSLVNDDENEQIACIVTRFAQSSPPQERTCETTLATIVDVLKYVSRVMLIPIRMNVRSSLEKIQNDRRITLFDLSELCASTASSTIDNPSSSTKLKMFRNGYEYARNVN